MRWRVPFASKDRVLGAALGISIAVHAVAMAVHFKMPGSLPWKPAAQPLEVVAGGQSCIMNGIS